jgi:serine/threonine protein kinase
MKKEDPFLNYEMNEKLGEGNFGEVFRAVHKKSGEERAIKILKIRLMK